MNKVMLWAGSALVFFGASAFLLYVLPRINGAGPGSVLANGSMATNPSGVAVVIATFGLAAGAALIGIGLGRWKRPRPSPHDGSPEV